MGQDYSYTQPSSSDEFDADLYADEGESSYTIAEADQYSPEPEADEGIPRTCYCGSDLARKGLRLTVHRLRAKKQRGNPLTPEETDLLLSALGFS
ncbi:hypothetical protein DY000_02010350 [Brassica cretica]|uniref:Uncharacterized protein n=1 Tax=Brassica cretica TaxID=69181 RepID=A0ABQ7C8M9_BRACR|nr:hypothetical protein DY000_02010350 [Brassica cretica]